ncbi:MAG: terminase, small subunit [Bacteriophage sp.]|jgi:hypothetical protein|nr:MAG: terminase, small subunit [Bacteriophage sp.]UVX93185.1 MAG: terminase, small subunit [Bacteriophage sp.]UWH90769.1 MAG: terminase, small subunit [Bacteriophage sp.]
MARKTMKAEFREILEKIPDDKKVIGKKLIEELSFMEKTLASLKRQIEENGELEHFQQGKQDFLRESPALKGYNTTVQRYSVMYRQLTDLMGKTQEAEKSNAVYDFLKEEKPLPLPPIGAMTF